MSSKHIRRYRTEYICIGFALVAAIVGHDDIQRQMDSLSADRARISASASETRQIEQSQQTVQERAAIAEKRYKDGCRIVVNARFPRNLSTLTKGQEVQDRISGMPLPAGTVVCDGNGNTGVLETNSQGVPVVGQMAFSGNRELAVAQIKKIRGAQVYFNVPQGK